MIDNIFEQALNSQEAWFVKSVDSDRSNSRLNISIDFKSGSAWFF